MTLEDIIKANELCGKMPSECNKCPYHGVNCDDTGDDCVEIMTVDTVNLLKSLKADCERLQTLLDMSTKQRKWLKAENEEIWQERCRIYESLKEAKTQACKEFASKWNEELKKARTMLIAEPILAKCAFDIAIAVTESVVKEMAGETNGSE